MTTPSADSENVEYNILLNAQQALKELQAFNRAAIDSGGTVDSLKKRIINFEQTVSSEAQKARVSFEQQLAAFEKLDTKLRSQKKFGVFGNSGGTDVFSETQKYHDQQTAMNNEFLRGLEIRRADTEQLVQYNKSLLNQGTVASEVTNKQKELGTATEQTGQKATKASQSTVAGINLVKTALHILVASAIFAVINAFQQLFSMAIKGLRELETATYNLINAERTLSEQGIAITPKGLDETIKKLQELDPLLSRIQATE